MQMFIGNDAFKRMGKLRFVLILNIFWALFCVAIFGDVFLDNSQENCVGAIEKKILEQNWTRYENIGSCYECLKTCLRELKGAKTAAYDSRFGCFCTHLNYIALNYSSCSNEGSCTISKPLIKIYNMSMFTVRLRFDHYIRQRIVFKVDLEVLRYQSGEIVKDPKLLKNVLSPGNCKVIRRKGKSHIPPTSCLGNFSFISLGKNEICLNTFKMCKIITVLEPVVIHDIEVGHGHQGQLLRIIEITGTVFNMSFALDNKSIKTLQTFAEYGEEVLKICHISLSLRMHSGMLGEERKLVISANNPVSHDNKVTYFTIKLDNLHLIVSNVAYATRYETNVEAKGDVIRYGDLTYTWSFINHCTSVTLPKNVTTVPRVTLVTPSTDLVSLVFCRISLVVKAKDGSKSNVVWADLFSNVQDERHAIEVNSPLPRGKEATFNVKQVEPGCSYIWKVNGKEVGRNTSFRHTFNATGSYNVSAWSDCGSDIKYFASKNVSVREKLTTLEIVITSFRYFGKPLTMRALTNSNEGVIYQWHCGDGVHYNTSSNTVQHRYYKPGIYIVHVIATNGISQINTTAVINETKVLCPACEFETSFEDGKEVEQFRSLPIHLEISTRMLNCLEPVNIVFRWTVWTNKLNVWHHWKKQKIDETIDSIYIPSNDLDYGRYSFNVTVIVSGLNTSYFEHFSIVYNVIESPLYAIIRGGLSRFVKRNSTFFLDASLSFDPDDPNASLGFRWSFPPAVKTTQHLDTAVIEVEATNFMFNESAAFKVTVSSGKRRNETTQHIAFQDIKTNMILDCPSCDVGHLNPSKPTTIMEKCIGDCPSRKVGLWRLREVRNEYGLPKLKPIHCTVSDQSSLSLEETNTIQLNYTLRQCWGARIFTTLEMETVCLKITRQQLFCSKSTIEAQLIFKRNNRHSEKLDINNNFFPGNKIFTIKRIEDEVSEQVVAERYFYVHDRPRDYSCHILNSNGVELEHEFSITCDAGKNARLVYKVVYKRKSADGKTVSNTFFQRKVPFFKFQLPSGFKGKVKNSIFITIENENGVAREYCAIDITVTEFVPGANISIEEYLYNRSTRVNKRFPDHPYAYHGQTLHNITLISDVLNRQPDVSNTTNVFRLRTRIREILIDILRRINICNEYISRQFASSLESCTRVPEELTNNSAGAVVDILHKLKIGKTHSNGQWVELAKDFQENILTVASRMMRWKEHEQAKLLAALTKFFEGTLRTKFVRTPLKIINITKDVFNTSLMKFSPYRSENIDFMSGETRIMFKRESKEKGLKHYDCNLFGCGLQAVTMDTNPFKDNDTYQKLSFLTKLKASNCKQIHDCKENVKEMKILFPFRLHKTTAEPAVHSLSSTEGHLFTLKWNSTSVLNIELVPLGPLPSKLKLKLSIRCADVIYRYLSDDEFIFFTQMDPLQKFISPESFSEKCKDLSVMVDILWELQPTRYDLLRTVVKYNMNVRSLGCVSKKGDNGNWSESCICKMDNSSVHLLNCSCPELESADYSYIAVSKPWPYHFKEITVESERNETIKIIMLVLSLPYAIFTLVLLFKERQRYKKNTAIPLKRGDPSHAHKYKITVFTGHCYRAGTTAKVAVVLHGENNSSYPVELFTENRELFRRNSKDIFVVSVQENLGDLNCIHLWHDNSGSSPSWFVDKLIIKDLSNNKKWMFRCCRWLAVDEHDRMLDCRIKPFDCKDTLPFKKFQLAIGEKLVDFHIWLSLFGMPKYSLFTRAERFTCCVVLTFAYLFFNAYFYHYYKDLVVIDCLSVFNPTWLQFKVGLFSTLACLPMYLLFTVFFRHSKSFVCLQPAKNAKVVHFNTTSLRKPNIDKATIYEKSDKLVHQMNNWSEDVRRNKQNILMRRLSKLELAALLLKAMRDEEDPASEQDYIYSVDQDFSTEITTDSHTPTSWNSCTNIVTTHKLSSEASGSTLHFERPNMFRLPSCFNVLLWIGCIMTLLLSSLYTVEYVSRFHDIAMRCYKQSVFWSLFISISISQPIQVFIVTVVDMIRRRFMLYSTMVDETAKEPEEDLLLDDSMFACYTEKNFEDPLYRKSLCLKYLQPLSRNAVTKARCKLQKRNTTVTFIRDVLVYFLLLILLYLLNPFWNQQSIFLHNDGLKTVLNRDTNTSSLLTWWSSSPQKFIDTLTFYKESPAVRAFRSKALVIGNPKLTIMFKYCHDASAYQPSASLTTEPKTNCTRKVEERTIRFNKTQKKNWLSLSHAFHEQFNEYVSDISLQFVLYSPSLDVYSVIKLSSHAIVGSHVKNYVGITTAVFYVDRSSSYSVHTIFQLLFTLVPVLLLVRQVLSCSTKINKKRAGLGVKVEFLIVFLSFFSVILMWIWIKYQYSTLGFLLDQAYEADVINGVNTIHKYQEVFKISLAFMLFVVLVKACHVIDLDKLLDRHIETFKSVPSVVLSLLFGLLIIFVGFAHMGVLLFGDHLKMFGTFLQAFALNVAYLGKTGTENFLVDTSYQQMLLALYVILFCLSMILFSNLVKAGFCQIRIIFWLTAKKKKRTPIKVYFLRKIKRVFSLIRSYLQKPDVEDHTLKRVPMSNIFKELNEQLNDLEFRLTHLTCKEDMPTKAVQATVDCSSTDGSDVEYVYTGDNNESPSKGSYFTPPYQENIAEPKVECASRHSSASGSMTTHAETEIYTYTSNLAQRRPFERSMRAFPAPINETMSSGHPQVLLNPFVGEEDCAASGKTTPEYLKRHAALDEQGSSLNCEVNEDSKVSSLSSSVNESFSHAIDNQEQSSGKRSENAYNYGVKCKDLYGRASGNCGIKEDKGGTVEPRVIFVNTFANNAFEADVGDSYDLIPRRPNVCLDAFEDESFQATTEPGRHDVSLENQSIRAVRTSKNNIGITSDEKPLTTRNRRFRQPTFSFSINELFTKSSEI